MNKKNPLEGVNQRDKRQKELLEMKEFLISEHYNRIVLSRFANIIMMVNYITSLSKEEILKNMKDTIVYNEIVSGNECFLYESYPANLEKMIREWKEKNIPILGQITGAQITVANMWLAGKLD